MEIEWDRAGCKDWSALLASAARGPFEQSWAYGAGIAETGGTVLRAVLRRDGAPVALVQVFARRFGPLMLRQLLRGPVFLGPEPDSETLLAALRLLQADLREKGRALTFWTPELSAAAAETVDFRRLGWRRVMTGHNTAWLDLRQDEDALRRGLAGKWRNSLVKAEKQGLTLQTGGDAAMETALAGYAYLRRARRFGGPSPALLRAAAAEAGSDPFLAMTAKAGGVPVAAAAFARHGRAATYSVGWSDAAGRRGNAAALLLWHGLLELKRQGTDWLDLGGIDTRAAPGIARFKLGLGGNIVTLAGTFL